MSETMFLSCEIEVLCLAILFVIVVNLWKLRQGSKQDMIFFDCATFCGVILVTDIVFAIVKGRPGKIYNYILYVDYALYFIFFVAAACSFWCYVDYSLTEDKSVAESRFVMYKIPAFCVMVISALSIFGKYIFYIDDENNFHQGNLYVIFTICVTLYVVLGWMYALIVFTKNHRIYANKNLYRVLFIYCTMIVSGLLFQLAYQDHIIMEPVFTLAMFMQYSNCQNAQLQIDPLTGLNNRFRFSRYILEQCKQLAVDDVMGCVVFSLDSVQNINERYGQGNGDLIIAEAADLLKECINGLAGNHYMARYSGKCLAVLSVASCDMSARIIQLYRDIVDEYNNSVENSFYISLSYGCATFDRYNMRPSELLSVAENDMQKNRTINKVNVMSVEDLI